MDQEKNKNLVLISLSLGIIICVLLYFSRRVIAPFFISFALSYLLDPLVDKIESRGISRTTSVLFLMIVFFMLVVFAGVFLVPLLTMQTESLVQHIPTYIGIFQEWLWPLLDMIKGLDPVKVEEFLNEGLSRFGELPMKVLRFSGELLWGSISNLFNIILMIANLVVIPVVMFYLLRDFDSINEKNICLDSSSISRENTRNNS